MSFSFLEKIDIYGEPFTFTIFKHEKFKTKIGGFMTLFTVLGCIFSFLFFGQDFFFRLNPSFLNSKQTLPYYPQYIINNSHIVAAIQINDNSGNLFNHSRYMRIQLVYQTYETVTPINGLPYLNKTNYNVPFMNCTNIKTDEMKMFMKKDLNQSLCVNFSNIPLGGYFDSGTIKQINVNLLPCKNDSSINKTDCYSLLDIYKELTQNKIWFNFYTNVVYTNLEDFERPLASTLFNIDLVIIPDFRKTRRIFYKRADISSDLGLLAKIPINYSLFGYDFFTFDYINQYPSFLDATDSTYMIQYSLVFNANIESFTIVYMKFQSLIANIGGFLTFFQTFSVVFTSFFRNHLMMLKLINKIFDFKDMNKYTLDRLIEEIKFPSRTVRVKNRQSSKSNMESEKRSCREYIETEKRYSRGYIETEGCNLSSEKCQKLPCEKGKLDLPINLSEIGGNLKIKDSLFRNKVKMKTKENFDIFYQDLKRKNSYYFNIPFCLILKKKFCPKKLTTHEQFLWNLFIQSKKIIHKKMDVVEYLRHVFEYLNLKYVMFHDILSLCLEFMEKPKVTENKNKSIIYKPKYEKMEIIVKYFAQRIDRLTEQEKKFYDILSDDVKNIINAFSY